MLRGADTIAQPAAGCQPPPTGGAEWLYQTARREVFRLVAGQSSLAALAGVVLSLAGLASWIAARRALRIPPVQAIRSE